MPTEASRRCDEIAARHSLLQHPFYRAWSDGTLPVAALRDYAREYGAFIRTIPGGWEAAGQAGVARTELWHAEIWERTFAGALQTQVGAPAVAEVRALVALAEEAFRDRATAVGALYAFEVQQPATAASKLAGLRDHYALLPGACKEYFEQHVGDDGEPAMLASMLDSLPAGERERAVAACEAVCEALYGALTAIHAPYRQ